VIPAPARLSPAAGPPWLVPKVPDWGKGASPDWNYFLTAAKQLNKYNYLLNLSSNCFLAPSLHGVAAEAAGDFSCAAGLYCHEGRNAMKRHLFLWILAAALIAAAPVAAAEGNPLDQKPVDKEAAAKLLPYITHQKIQVRAAIAELLGENCCKGAADALVNLMKTDEVPGVRMVAAQALAKAKVYSAIAEMRDQARKDDNQTVRHVLTALAAELEIQNGTEKSLAAK